MIYKDKLLICRTVIHQPPVILQCKFPRCEIRFQGNDFINPLYKHPERDPSDHLYPQVIPETLKIFEFPFPFNQALVLLFPECDRGLFCPVFHHCYQF